MGETPSSNLFLHQANLCTARKHWKTMLGFVSIDFTWTCISFCVFYTSCICFFLYMAHEDRTQYLMTMLTMFWFVSYVFFLLCFHPVSVDLTCSTEVSIAPWALSPSIPPSRSTDSEKNVQNLLVKFVCWSGFQENVPPPNLAADEEMKECLGFRSRM